MASLGIPEACRVDLTDDNDEEPAEDAIVSKEVFMKNAKIGLAKATATFVS